LFFFSEKNIEKHITKRQALKMLTRRLAVRSATFGNARTFSEGSFVDRVKKLFIFHTEGETGFKVYPTKGGKGRIAGYRYPSPGSASEGANIPSLNEGEDPYNTQYYTRDTTAHKKDIFVISSKTLSEGTVISESKLGSPGNKNPAVLKYDPTGTRSAMTTTWEALDAELAKHQPNHLPTPCWELDGIDVAAECERKGIPPQPGKPRKWIVPKEMYDDKW